MRGNLKLVTRNSELAPHQLDRLLEEVAGVMSYEKKRFDFMNNKKNQK